MMKNKIKNLKKELEMLILSGKSLSSSEVIKKALELEVSLSDNLESAAS